MRVAIITAPREPSYLKQTFWSLDAATAIDDVDGIDVFYGGPPQDFPRWLDNLEPTLLQGQHGGVTEFLFTTEWERVKDAPPATRAVANFVNALEMGPVANDDLVIFEDDVIVKPGWVQALKQITKITTDRAFVSLYSPLDFRRCSCDAYPGEESPWSHCPTHGRNPSTFQYLTHSMDARPNDPAAVHHFRGTCGLFVPGRLRASLAAEARQHLNPDDPRKWPFDEIVKQYVNDRPNHNGCGVFLAVSIPSWVDHLGEVSLLNPTHGPRRAPMF